MIVFELYILFVAHSLLVSESTSVALLSLAQDVHHRVSLTTHPVQLKPPRRLSTGHYYDWPHLNVLVVLVFMLIHTFPTTLILVRGPQSVIWIVVHIFFHCMMF